MYIFLIYRRRAMEFFVCGVRITQRFAKNIKNGFFARYVHRSIKNVLLVVFADRKPSNGNENLSRTDGRSDDGLIENVIARLNIYSGNPEIRIIDRVSQPAACAHIHTHIHTHVYYI